MKRSFSKIFKDHRREKGIALLFTLGILGLLTVLALSFAASSMMERKAAQYNAGASAARIMGKAGLNRAVAAMTLYKHASYENFEQMMSHCPSSVDSVNYATFDQLYKMTTMADGTSSFFDIEGYKSDNDNATHWIYIYNGKEASATEKEREIIGRFAYLVSAAGGRLDPAVCVTSGKDESQTRTVGTYYVPRVGVSPEEIYIGDLDPSFSSGFLTSGDVTNFSYSPAGLYNGTSWASYDTLFNAMAITSIIKKLKWQWDWFKAGADSVTSDEAYWKDLNGDKKKTNDEKFHRFNLARTDWTSLPVTVDLLMGVSSTTPLSINASATSSSTTGIEWFSSYSSLPQKTFSNSEKRIKQIAANLIDYSDTDSIPTSDVSSNNFLTTAPTYTGNEKTPYINELKIDLTANTAITCTAIDTDADSTNDSYQYTGTLSVSLDDIYGEVIKIYADTLGTNDLGASRMYVKAFTITINYTDLPGSTGSATISVPQTELAYSASTGTYSVQSAVPSATPATVTATTTVVPMTSSATYKLSVDSIVFPQIGIALSNDAASEIFIDYSVLPTITLPISSADPVSKATVSGGTVANPAAAAVYADWEADDPRQNLNTGDWLTSDSEFSLYGVTGATRNGPNAVTASANGDKEDIAASGALVSTAYIRDEPMKSPGELGLIHRGAKWETINLKKTTVDVFGAGEYDNGDGVLLDEIKMVSADSSKGLINLKSAKELIVSNNDSNNNAILRCLFSGIYVNSDYANISFSTITPTGVVVDTGIANTLARNVKTYTENNFCKNRAEVINAVGLCDASISSLNQDTDAKKEAIVGRCLALTTIEPSTMFKVIVLAQTIKDIGGPSNGDGDITHKRDFDNDNAYSASNLTSEAAMKNAGFAWYSPFDGTYKYFSTSYLTGTMAIKESTACRKGRYEVGHDVITGEQKVVAILKYDDSVSPARWKILSYEVVSE